ncbi:uncharacterized protein LOC131318905 [Rhododendron vialii]|uniref:uncharacterized protein LOC131318905 n=1 Tax=Rhododendron vialii TaxID=182163 RepID=UPI00266030D5|nr:uncharacterized protein LOC131318905 [Rhododendron vialii]
MLADLGLSPCLLEIAPQPPITPVRPPETAPRPPIKQVYVRLRRSSAAAPPIAPADPTSLPTSSPSPSEDPDLDLPIAVRNGNHNGAFADWKKCYSEQQKKLSPLVRDNCGEGARCTGTTCDKKHLIVTFLITDSGTLKFPSINSHSDLDMALDSLEYILYDIVLAGKVWWASRHDTKDLSYL